MSLQAVIFDMDGTLIDSMPFHAKSWFGFFEKKGISVSEEALQEKGHGTLYDIIPRFFGAHLTPEESYTLAMEKEELFREIYAPHMELLPGTREWLDLLKSKNIAIGMGTAADFTNADFTLDTLHIRSYFDTIVTSDLVPEGKPSPAVYLYVAEKLGVTPENCLVFEDTFSGVESGLAAGMKVAAITTMHPAEVWQQKTVHRIYHDFTEVDFEELSTLFF